MKNNTYHKILLVIAMAYLYFKIYSVNKDVESTVKRIETPHIETVVDKTLSESIKEINEVKPPVFAAGDCVGRKEDTSKIESWQKPKNEINYRIEMVGKWNYRLRYVDRDPDVDGHLLASSQEFGYIDRNFSKRDCPERFAKIPLAVTPDE